MQKLRLILLLQFPFLFLGCQVNLSSGPASLSIDNITFSGELVSTFLDLPDGTYQPDHPNFHPDRPETWTGNMAKYVKRFYSYTVEYTISNSANGIAYDTEVDMYFEFNNGDEDVKTLYLGSVQPNSSVVHSTFINSINKQLDGCSAEVYWYD